MSLSARARMRPVLYPAAILLAFVLNFLVDTGVSPYAAGRPVIVAVVIGLALAWLAGLAVGDRHVAGLIAAVLVLTILVAQAPLLAALCAVTVLLIGLQRVAARRQTGPSASERLWPLATRILTAGAVIMLVAVGLKAVQAGRVDTFAHDLAAEFPLRPQPAIAAASSSLPNIYLLLLDGYPRADKLATEFGIDNTPFTDALGARGFTVAERSRSNHTITYMTLDRMFGYGSSQTPLAGASGGRLAVVRQRINEGAFFRDIRSLGYRTTAISPAFENVALRQADVYIDTGQLNEFEWVLVEMTGLRGLLDALAPRLTADLHRARVLEAFLELERVAQEPASGPRFVHLHVVSPHAPQAFGWDGNPTDVAGAKLPYADPLEIDRLGWAEYARRLGGQITFLNGLTLAAVDTIIREDPSAVVVVFSDHGSGARWSETEPSVSDVDLRTANLLAVRSPGATGIIDDRSTLVNVLPRILRSYAGIGPDDVPETIWAWGNNPELTRVFERPD